MDSMDTLGSQKVDDIKDRLKQQIAVNQMQSLVSNITHKCFMTCIHKPGERLDNTEKKCITMCMDRFIDSWNAISRAYGKRLEQEHNKEKFSELDLDT